MTSRTQDSALVRALIGMLFAIGVISVEIAKIIEQLTLNWEWFRDGCPVLYRYPVSESEYDYDDDDTYRRHVYVAQRRKSESSTHDESVLVEWPVTPNSRVITKYNLDNWVVAEPADAAAGTNS